MSYRVVIPREVEKRSMQLAYSWQQSVPKDRLGHWLAAPVSRRRGGVRRSRVRGAASELPQLRGVLPRGRCEENLWRSLRCVTGDSGPGSNTTPAEATRAATTPP